MPVSYSHNDKVSRSRIPSRTLRQESDNEDTVCETDVAQWQLLSFSGCMLVASFMKSIITSIFYCAAAKNLSFAYNWLLG